MYAKPTGHYTINVATFDLADAPEIEAVEERHRTPRTMRPDTITIRCSEGSLISVEISGPRLNRDGEPGLYRNTVRWGAGTSHARMRTLAELPEWVRGFADRLINCQLID